MSDEQDARKESAQQATQEPPQAPSLPSTDESTQQSAHPTPPPPGESTNQPPRPLLRLRDWLTRRWRQRLTSLALLAAVLLATGAWQTRHMPSGPAPALVGTLPDGRTLTLEQWRAAHPGRAVAVHFWAAWCGICQLEQGNVSSVMRDWPVLTVATRSGDGRAVARALATRGLTQWPTIVDESGAIARAWGASGVPAFIVIDPQGHARAASMGYTPTLTMRLRLWWAQHF